MTNKKHIYRIGQDTIINLKQLDFHYQEVSIKHFMKCILFITALFLCACDQEKLNKSELINITFDDKEEVKASTFIDNAQVIKLETNDNCLIQEIHKIQYIKNQIYILDIIHNAIFIFNEDGSFDKKLSKRGNGPGEYIQLIDFFFHDSFLYVMDFSTQSILKYNLDLEYIDRMKYNTFGSKFVIKNDQFWIYNEPTGQTNDHVFSCINQAGNETFFLPRKFLTHEYNWGDVNTFSIYNGRIFASQKHGNIIYQETNHHLEPIYEINFNGKNFPEKENINDHNIYDEHFAYILKETFLLSNKYFIFSYFHKRNRHFCFYNMKDKSYSFGLIKNDLLESYFFAPKWGNDNYLIDEVASHYITEDFSFLGNYNKQLKYTKEDDNPIIIIYALKK